MSRYQKINEGKYRKVEDDIYEGERSFTIFDIVMGITAVFVLFVVGIRHLQSWGKTGILEMSFCLFSLLTIDYIKTRVFKLGKPYKKFEIYVLPRMIIILISIVAIQMLTQIVFTIDNIELALLIVFASVAEEMFFRGVIVSTFREIDKKIKPLDPDKIVDIPIIGKTNLNIRAIGMLGVFLSALFFAAIHINYYDNPPMLLGVFLGGLAFGFFYYIWEDLLASIIAHFILNIIAVYQSGLLVNLSGSYNPIVVLILTIIFGVLCIFLFILKKPKKNKQFGYSKIN